MPSSFRRRFISSISRSLDCFGGAFGSLIRGRRGARPGAGNTHWMCALRQFPHGMYLSHRTLRRRHVTHDLGFSAADGVAVGSSVIEPVGTKGGGAVAGAAEGGKLVWAVAGIIVIWSREVGGPIIGDWFELPVGDGPPLPDESCIGVPILLDCAVGFASILLLQRPDSPRLPTSLGSVKFDPSHLDTCLCWYVKSLDDSIIRKQAGNQP